MDSTWSSFTLCLVVVLGSPLPNGVAHEHSVHTFQILVWRHVAATHDLWSDTIRRDHSNTSKFVFIMLAAVVLRGMWPKHGKPVQLHCVCKAMPQLAPQLDDHLSNRPLR